MRQSIRGSKGDPKTDVAKGRAASAARKKAQEEYDERVATSQARLKAEFLARQEKKC